MRLFARSVTKLVLNLLILVGLAGLVRYSYVLFTTQQEEPLRNAVLLVIGIAAWFAVVVLSRSRRHKLGGSRPSFKLTTFLTVATLVVFAFAGVQPLADYKDRAIVFIGETYTSTIEGLQSINVGVSTEPIPQPTEREDEDETTTEPVTTISAKSFKDMFNEYRQSYGLPVLVFTDDLNRVAKLRLTEIQVSYSHFSPGKYNQHLAENINMISFGSMSGLVAFNSWKNSPGHNANMLNPSYKYTGYANGGGYAVQVFTQYETIDGEPQLPPRWYWPN